MAKTSRIRCIAALILLTFLSDHAHASQLSLPTETPAILDRIYSFDLVGAVQSAHRLQEDRPEHPLGYLLEAEASWWGMWCESAEFKYGMTDARHRPKLDVDQPYLQLIAKISSLAETQIKQHDSAEMQFYGGMADAAAARFYALRGENRNVARAAVRAREHFLRAKSLDPTLADADFGLGLYDYYVDTLGTITKILRFFMGIPGGSKQEGIRLLENSLANGELTPTVARFYLALNLHRYDQQYERALALINALAEKYPSNPLFQLARGDLLAKLGRKEQALTCYRAAASLTIEDAKCSRRVQELATKSIAALGLEK